MEKGDLGYLKTINLSSHLKQENVLKWLSIIKDKLFYFIVNTLRIYPALGRIFCSN